jgi:TM2 domain-containing membrane protein YozV
VARRLLRLGSSSRKIMTGAGREGNMTTPAGWYGDPGGGHQVRYWDGAGWTEQVADSGVQSTDPPVDGYAAPVNPSPGILAAVPPRATSYASGAPTSGKKIPAGICGILLGALGVHKFILGYTSEGLIMLLVSVLTCGVGAIVMGPIGLIEGIIYLTKSDEEFDATYVHNKRGWF